MNSKKLTLAICLGAPCVGMAGINEFDQVEALKEIHILSEVLGEREEARKLINDLQDKMDKSDKFYDQARRLAEKLNNSPQFDQKKSEQFMTGEKDEYYCRGKGLVYIAGKHNDGTKSSLKAIQINRKMKADDYSLFTGGDWIYELDTDYRDPIRSESWVNSADESSFNIEENRKNFAEYPYSDDRGKFEASWVKSNSWTSYQTYGQTPEPSPTHLGNDYHLWGAFDLGFKLKFEIGYTDTGSSREGGPPKSYMLKSKRTVAEHLAEFNYKDSEDKSYVYQDCFRVHSKIEFDRYIKN